MGSSSSSTSGPADDRLCDGQPLAPAAAQGRCLILQPWKSYASTGLAQPALALCFRYTGPLERTDEHLTYGQTVGEVRLLLYIADPRPPADGHLTRIGILLSGEHSQKGRLPCSVWPDQPNPVSIRNRKRDLLKQWHSAKTL